MIFTIKPLLVPSFERRFQLEVNEVTMQASLDANATNNLALSNTRLILQKEVMFEQREVGVDGKIGLA
jgi:hypothetical protein